MKEQMLEKARANRTRALGYVETQKEKLLHLAGLNRDGKGTRGPIPMPGFSSTRTEQAAAIAAA